MPVKRSFRKKALLAVLFAGGMLDSCLPVFCEGTAESTFSVIEQVSNDARIGSAESRAFFLLWLANRYLAVDDATLSEVTVESVLNDPAAKRVEGSALTSWAKEVATRQHFANYVKASDRKTTSRSEARSPTNIKLADQAVQQALLQLDNCSNLDWKLNGYFIASRLFEKIGDIKEMRKCDEVLKNVFQSCEKAPRGDWLPQSLAASSLLDIMAFGILPVIIPIDQGDIKWAPTISLEIFTERDFSDAEKLKLRAVAILDKLPAQSQFRRKAHRDLALWYLHLGKMELAEQQKQTLFDLVGIHDDSILFPRKASNGRLIWWQIGRISDSCFGCGMG
jgi:hypothetical protein